MDLLAKRYANPFVLLDEMISQHRLLEFVYEINAIKNEEDLFNVWLYRVWDKPFNEWKESLKTTVKQNDNYNAKATVKNSYDILKGFNPEMGR